MLHGPKEVRQIIFDRSDPRTPYRNLERDEVFRAYLRKLLERLPSEYQSRRKYALMPSIAEERTRTRYKNAVEAAIPGITVLPEPEMVGEYFRLLKRTLELEEGRNHVLLVVDVGASTANMTLILSRRDGTIVDVDQKGAQRDLRLRALRGDSVGLAGRWVDRRIVEMLHLETTNLDEALREIEKAKVKVSHTGKPSSFEVPGSDQRTTLNRETLASVSGELWNELRPLFERLCERLYHNQTSSEAARQKSETRMRDLGINSANDAHRLIDTILLAGGTSLLPGFEEAMMNTLFADGSPPKVLRVGSSFAIAAAAGGLAHILQNYDPPRLHDYNSPNEEVFSATLESTLPYALLLGIKQPGDNEQPISVLDANDPFVDDGGVRPIEGLPALAKGSHPKMRLVPGLEAGVAARQGRPFKAMLVRQSPGKMQLKWDPIRERATIQSVQVDGTAAYLWIDANKLRKRVEPAIEPFEGPLAPGTLAVDGAEDLVFDLGMSKIVAIAATRGWTSAEELDRVMLEGLDEESEVRSTSDDVSEPELLDPVQRNSSYASDQEISIVADVENEETNVNSGETRTEDPRSERHPTSGATGPVQHEIDDSGPRYDWIERVPDAEFTRSLAKLRDSVNAADPSFYFDDAVVALLALAVRPVVLLAGPPGCGKSTLVRLLAQMLGKQAGHTFHEIAVQAHWENDTVLFEKGGLLEKLFHVHDHSHLILFDEFNLTRPEYYLSRLFHALDGGHGSIAGLSNLAPCRVLGTLNIDDSSRPPSPKIIDRCFLLELSQIAWNAEVSPGMVSLKGIRPLPGLPNISMGGAGTDGHIETVLQALNVAVHDHDLRHDLLPSRRVLADIRAVLSLHHRLDLQARGLLDRDELVDRVIASRILVKISGAVDQLSPALDALEKVVRDVQELPRTRRRLKLARQQARLGFVSPWQ